MFVTLSKNVYFAIVIITLQFNREFKHLQKILGQCDSE